MKSHYCPEEKTVIDYEGECNWCGEKEMNTKEALNDGYWCVFCQKIIEADKYGVIVHDDVDHGYADFTEESNPQ